MSLTMAEIVSVLLFSHAGQIFDETYFNGLLRPDSAIISYHPPTTHINSLLHLQLLLELVLVVPMDNYKLFMFRNSEQSVNLVTKILGQHTVQCSPVQRGYSHQPRHITIEVNIQSIS